jgi:tRNA pseudouridine55 synthase
MTPATTDGLLLLDKPAGISSHDAVLAARRAAREKRIGHAGTLDPFATGLLVLLLGKATRLLPYLPGEPKVYEATIQFGRETDTEDLLGAVTHEASLPRESEVRAAIPSFTGRLMQVPPAYSAKRVDGRRSYEAARAGEAVELAPVSITVHSWDLLAWRSDACDVRITCAGGTYIRSLARDLGRAVGSAAHLTALRRTHIGPYDVGDAQTVDALRQSPPCVQPALAALPHLTHITLDRDQINRLRRGLTVRVDGTAEPATRFGAMVAAETGQLVALAEYMDGAWQPRVQMSDA